MTVLPELRSELLRVARDQAARAAPLPAARARVTTRLRVPVAILATAAAVCIVILLLPGGRGGTPNLAARAYAATTGAGVIHWRTELHTYSNGRHTDHQRLEGWARNGVTHLVRYEVARGRARLADDVRIAKGRSKTYIASADDYITGPAPRRTSADPFTSGDPFAIFRQAYRTGKLRKVGPQRYAVDLPGNDDNAISAIYDLDSDTALPRRFTSADSIVSLGKRYDNRTVMRFETYERLPFTAATRVRLRLLPHPGAGPKDDPAADHFSVLRGERRPGPGALRAIERLAGDEPRFALDAAGARALGPGRYLVPGHGYVCLATSNEMGFGASCLTIAQAVERGIGSGSPTAGTTVCVPDGVRALRARERGGRSETVAVHGGCALLPFSAYAWVFVR